MSWFERFFRKSKTGTDPNEADRVLDYLVSARGDGPLTADQTPQQLIDQGTEARRREQPEIAHNLFVEALASARALKDTVSVGRAMVALADNALHFYPENADVFAIRGVLAQRAKEIFASIGNEEGVAKALRVQSTMVPGHAGREMLEESLRICKRIGDVDGIASSLDRLGCHLALYGDKAEANSFKRKSVEMARTLGDEMRIASSLFSLAIGFDGSQAEHRAILEECASINQRLGRKTAQARCLMLCAQLACEASDHVRREKYVEAAAQISREAGDLSMCGICLDLLIDILRERGDSSGAEAIAKERKLLLDDDFPKEVDDELREAFSGGDIEETLSTVRKWFSGGTWNADGTR